MIRHKEFIELVPIVHHRVLVIMLPRGKWGSILKGLFCRDPVIGIRIRQRVTYPIHEVCRKPAASIRICPGAFARPAGDEDHILVAGNGFQLLS